MVYITLEMHDWLLDKSCCIFFFLFDVWGWLDNAYCYKETYIKSFYSTTFFYKIQNIFILYSCLFDWYLNDTTRISVNIASNYFLKYIWTIMMSVNLLSYNIMSLSGMFQLFGVNEANFCYLAIQMDIILMSFLMSWVSQRD